MADTHINAFYAAVDEAKQELALAEGKVAQAEQALKNHPDYKAEKQPVELPPVEPTPKTKKKK